MKSEQDTQNENEAYIQLNDIYEQAVDYAESCEIIPDLDTVEGREHFNRILILTGMNFVRGYMLSIFIKIMNDRDDDGSINIYAMIAASMSMKKFMFDCRKLCSSTLPPDKEFVKFMVDQKIDPEYIRDWVEYLAGDLKNDHRLDQEKVEADRQRAVKMVQEILREKFGEDFEIDPDTFLTL